MFGLGSEVEGRVSAKVIERVEKDLALLRTQGKFFFPRGEPDYTEFQPKNRQKDTEKIIQIQRRAGRFFWFKWYLTFSFWSA